MHNFRLALLGGGTLLALSGAARAEGVGGITKEVCSAPAVTSGSAYAAGNEVGAVITLTPAFRPVAQGGASDSGGIVQSIRLNTKSVQTAGFKAYQFVGLPTTTLTDKTTPSINAADSLTVRPPISLSNNDSGLGTMTVYGADQIARAHVAVGLPDYWLIVTTGTPTFASTTDLMFCVTYLQD